MVIAVEVANDEVGRDRTATLFLDNTVERLVSVRVIVFLAFVVGDAVMLDDRDGAAQEVPALCRTGYHSTALYVATSYGEGTPAAGAGAGDLVGLLPAGAAAVYGTFAVDWLSAVGARR